MHRDELVRKVMSGADFALEWDGSDQSCRVK